MQLPHQESWQPSGRAWGGRNIVVAVLGNTVCLGERLPWDSKVVSSRGTEEGVTTDEQVDVSGVEREGRDGLQNQTFGEKFLVR